MSVPNFGYPAKIIISLLIFESIFSISADRLQFSHPSKPGGAGYALVFHDNVVIKKDFKDFPEYKFTFEAWVSTSDFCHPGAIMSYAKPTKSKDSHDRTKAANHFVIFDTHNIIACHDFEFIDIIPDLERKSCHAFYNRTQNDLIPLTGKVTERDGRWHHLAVTWDGQNDGEIIIYIDGSIVGRAVTHKIEPLARDGAFMLGGEQDCFGGCTDPNQGFYGMIDEVRIWKVVRTHNEIIQHMRKTGGDMDNHPDLAAYWKFDDPGSEDFENSGIIHDSSGKGNDLDLLVPPSMHEIKEKYGTDYLKTSALVFKNNFAMNSHMDKMPTKDFTIEFWAQASAVDWDENPLTIERYSEFLSFSTMILGDGVVGNDYGYADTAFIDDAIRIERYLTEYNGTRYLTNANVNTMGSISVHINANREGNGKEFDNWLDFATNWIDNKWHHVAVTWEYDTGKTMLFFDGNEIKPFWVAKKGEVVDKDPNYGGVDPVIGAMSERSPYGSLVLGQNQECYGGCFSPSSSFDGAMANLRVWNRVLRKETIRENMFSNDPFDKEGLVLNYVFDEDKVKGDRESQYYVFDHISKKSLKLGSVQPTFQYSYAPLEDYAGVALPKPDPGYMGYSLGLSDQQVLMLQHFDDFPSRAITVEFWMWSIDSCREGVPFSYATGDYQKNDNAFLIFNYNNWGVSVMEDEGLVNDHNAGFSSTDGTWHHIAVTWDSSTGATVLYDNGRPQWRVQRSVGKTIPSGGTLVIGREQDCLGGCFDSDPGAAGNLDSYENREYNAQDFFGVIDQIRIWKVVRNVEEIYLSMKYDLEYGSGTNNNYISKNDPNLVAWWKFDEGSGYTVSDDTGHGHLLTMSSEPKWIVSKWLKTCGNGILEALEECDDGNRENGDGCSADCQIENGWTCDLTSPSMCTQNSFVNTEEGTRVEECFAANCRMSSVPKSDKEIISQLAQLAVNEKTSVSNSQTKSVSQDKNQGYIGKFLLYVTIFAIMGFLVYIVYRKRDTIYEYVPAVEEFVHSSKETLNRAMGRHSEYSLVAIDPEETNVSPGFIHSQPPSKYERQVENIPYEPINDGRRK